jgi:hypothetical protein
MLTSFNRKEAFLTDFQDRYQQGKKLLANGNHHWATRLIVDLFFKIESEVWISSQKKQQLILELSKLWIEYINSFRSNGTINDLIKYIDAYDRFFSFLIQIEDYNLFEISINQLLRSFGKMDKLSMPGISKFVNSISIKFMEQKNYIQLIELQFFLISLKESLVHSKYFQKLMDYLHNLLLKIEPDKRPLFLFAVLENINLKFKLRKGHKEFIDDITKKINPMVPPKLKEYISELSNVIINERTFKDIKEDLFNLISYLNNIGESAWTIVLIRNLYSYIKEFQSMEAAVDQIRQFIEFSIDRSRLNVVYTIYDYLESILLSQSDKSYNKIVIELWVDACHKFSQLKEKQFLLLSIEKLLEHLKIPEDHTNIFHYLHTCNYLWKFRSIFFSFKEDDFWRMIFYRALYQNHNIDLAQKIIPHLDKRLQPYMRDCNFLIEVANKQRNEIYTLEETENYYFQEKNLHIVNMVIKIDSLGEFSYRIYYSDENILERTFRSEHWNDTYIIKLYNNLFSDSSKTKYKFVLKEFGIILYLLLPKVIRNYFAKFREQVLRPQIYFIFDKMTIPFELIYKKGFFLFGYSIGYNIGSPPIMGAKFVEEKETSRKNKNEKGYNALLIDSINALAPKRWNEDKNRKELLYKFSSGANELSYMKELFTNRSEIQNLKVLMGSESSKKSILDAISQGSHHIIYIVGNIIFSESHPSHSYFITNDNLILKFADLFDALEQQVTKVNPIIFFDTQIFDRNGNRLKEGLGYFSEIISKFNFNNIKGIICRNYPEFSSETKSLILDFFNNLFKKNSIGISLLKARDVLLPKVPKLIKQQLDGEKPPDPDIDKSKNVTLENCQAFLSFLFFGEPWQKL